MNWADWGILGIIAISGLMSLRRGFIKEAISLATWVIAFIIARVFAGSLSIYLKDYIDTPSLSMLAAFAILFIATLMVGAVVGALFGALISATGLNSTDRVLGMGFGFVRGALVVVVIIALLGMTPAVIDDWWKSSTLIPHFLLLEDWTRDIAADLVTFIWNAGAN